MALEIATGHCWFGCGPQAEARSPGHQTKPLTCESHVQEQRTAKRVTQRLGSFATSIPARTRNRKRRYYVSCLTVPLLPGMGKAIEVTEAATNSKI